jgi:hypothetical protein
VNLLGEIQTTLNNMVSVGETFTSYGGDIEYFVTPASYSNPESEGHVYRLLSSIKGTFETLKGRRNILLELQKSCQDSRKDVCSHLEFPNQYKDI